MITGNVATGVSPASQGGGIWIVNQSDALIVQNLVSNNTAGQGSGIYFGVPSGDRGPILVNNTIIGGSGGSQGSAVYASGFDNQVQFFNNLMIGPSGQNAVYCDGTYGGQTPTFVNNDAFSPSGTGLAGQCLGQIGFSGNISADPQFVNAAAGDFHLQSTSSAIDAGTNSAPNLPQTDFAGNPRILDGNNDCVSIVDMGAYELAKAANASFSIGSLTFPNQLIGNFAQSNNCSGGVRGGSSCVFNITFTPSAIGTRSGMLAVTGFDGVTTTTPSVSLSGTGVDFSIAATPSSATIKHARAAQFNVSVAPLGGAVSSAVALSCSGLPSAASCSFSPSSVIPGSNGANSAPTLSTSGNTPRGTFNVQIVGISGVTQHSTTVQLTVN